MRLHLGDCLEVLPTYAPRRPDFPDPGQKPFVDMVFADLPYGVTANKWDSPLDLRLLWPMLLAMAKPNAVFVFTATQPFATTLINSQPKIFRYDLVWDKVRAASFADANLRPLRSHETTLVFYRNKPTYNPQKTYGHVPVRSRTSYVTSTNGGPSPIGKPSDDSRFPLSIISIKRDDMRGKNGHPTQKPVALLEWLIKTYSNPGDIILDPTMGSGTTCVAAINTGRRFIGIEKDPTYFRTAARRVQETLR